MNKKLKAREISSPVSLIKDSVRIYFKRENLIYFTKLMLVYVGALIFLGIYLFWTSSYFFSDGANIPSNLKMLAILFLLTFIFVSIITQFWIQAAVVQAVINVRAKNKLFIRETFNIALKKLKRYSFVSILYFLVVILGLTLLIIPGVIFATWFSFAGFLVMQKNLKPIEALKESRELVRKHFWPVFGRWVIFIVLFILMQIGFSLIPYVGPIAAAIFTPYMTLLPYLLFEELNEI
ncbi:hypothetical protein HY008_02470 [Candidatus Woesebacteria bacterium]|nr:hypothetical protein [Candidatus Woesebacteria bacterium]